MESHIAIAEHAKNQRENMGLSESDVVPDIVDLTKAQKYQYVEEFVQEEYAGYSEYLGDWIYRIGFNTCHDYGLPFKRFTLAHELGHVFMPSHQEILQKHKLHRSNQSDKCEKVIETEADSFAANFLAPSKACLELIRDKNCTPATIISIAERFNISTFAASFRFVELTDFVCTMIVFNESGKTEFERRSPNMEARLKGFFIPYARKMSVHEHTLSYEHLRGKRDVESCESTMNLWHPKLPKEVPVTEAVLDLGYGGKFVALITPMDPYLDEYLAEEERDSAVRGD